MINENIEEKKVVDMVSVAVEKKVASAATIEKKEASAAADMASAGKKRKVEYVQQKLEWAKKPKTTSDEKGNGQQKILASSSLVSLVTDGEYGNLEMYLDENWRTHFAPEFRKPYWGQLMKHLNIQHEQGKIIWPIKSNIFAAFNICPVLSKIKVVILAQDPYPGSGDANGLCFSAGNLDAPLPKSLVTIFREVKSNTLTSGGGSSSSVNEYKTPVNGCLKRWAEQGVLLLNCTMTVNENEPNSHKDFGWATFTDVAIKYLSSKGNHIVFLLWGSFAHRKGSMIDQKKHRVLKAAHPSPRSPGVFLGNKHFSMVNAYLESVDKSPINW